MTRATGISLCLLLLATATGCPQYRDPRVPNPIVPVAEPDLGGEYLLYTPSTYDPSRAWPLIVVCHGTKPWDYPLRQIRDWVKLAEEKGFVVAAPELIGTKAGWPAPAADAQIKKQQHDEETILATVRHLQGSHNISRDRIFLTGWSAGNYAVLHTGLRHPDVFRALAVLQGNFDAVYVSRLADQIDPFQPVYVLYGAIDVLTGKQGKNCVQWLRENRAAVTPEEVGGSHRGHPTKAYHFFNRVIRKVPWLRIRAFAADPRDPMTVQFKTHASFEPQVYRWTFGDQETSPVATPMHGYMTPGEYTVTLTAETEAGRKVRRAISLTVPQKPRL
ncbi:MAG: prolyl oligopeptidase family serine peptidase [bacterium]|nr:prolyl oligopeptidase family serine peptidase [bacterium]